jgi:hypothetical protein
MRDDDRPGTCPIDRMLVPENRYATESCTVAGAVVAIN